MTTTESFKTFFAEVLSPLIDKAVSKAFREFSIPSNQEEKNKLMTIQEAAEFLNLAVPTLYTMTSKHTIPYRKRGKKLYFRQLELEEWLESGKKKSVAELDKEASEYIAKKELGNGK